MPWYAWVYVVLMIAIATGIGVCAVLVGLCARDVGRMTKDIRGSRRT